MRRIITFILLLSWIPSLCGCGLFRNDDAESVSFYYMRSEFQYNTEENIIVAESRKVSGHIKDVNYVLSLYLMGPLDEALLSPFLPGTRLYHASQGEDGVISIILSSQDNLTDSYFSLACACMALTCMNHFETDAVSISSGQRSIVMTRDSLLLQDIPFQQE